MTGSGTGNTLELNVGTVWGAVARDRFVSHTLEDDWAAASTRVCSVGLVAYYGRVGWYLRRYVAIHIRASKGAY